MVPKSKTMRMAVAIILLAQFASCQQTLEEMQDYEDIFSPMSARSYAYISAVLVMMGVGVLVYFHVKGIRRDREINQQFSQQYVGDFQEWSPLLMHNNKNIRCAPPPYYEQVV